jgi:uncharacterized DUF497 family protein
MASEFEWDSRKALLNQKKHGVSFHEAQTIFGDPFELTIADPDHSTSEFRFLSIGKSDNGRVLVVIYTEREPNKIRIISARAATKREIKQYEQF